MARPALPTLLKLADKKLEDIQQQLHANRAAQQGIARQITHWEQEVATAFAAAIAEDAVRDLQAAHAYQQRAAAAIMQLNTSRRALQATEAELLNALQSAYTTQQQYKQLLEAQTLRAKQTASRKAQANLDDLKRR